MPVPHFCHADQQHERQIEIKQRREMKRTNANRKILLPFCMVAAMIYVYFSFIYTDSHQFNHFILDNSDNQNESLPLNYFLLNEKTKEIKSFLVNKYTVENNYLYFTEINGRLLEDFGFYDNKLHLSRINLETNRLERFINEKEYPDIFLKINDLDK